MNCGICFENFNHTKHKPYSISTCPHTYCLTCIQRLWKERCPQCRAIISDINVNISLLKFIPETDENFTKSFNDFVHKGDELFVKRKYNDSIIFYDKAIDLDPSCAKVFYNKAMSLLIRRDVHSALQCFDQALMLNKNNSNYFFGKGLALQKLGRFCEALECFNKSIEIDKKKTDSFFSLANLYSSVDYFEEVLLNKDPSNVSFMIEKVFILCDIGKIDRAIELINEAIETDQCNSSLYNLKGDVYLHFDKYSESLECFEKSIELNSAIHCDAFFKRKLLKEIIDNRWDIICVYTSFFISLFLWFFVLLK